ncbi:hypothetical protein GF385_00375 [Candidatus Dependentiae bacterium]|nr:hypothetical protein [Candidatus Dependentiae bacterium]
MRIYAIIAHDKKDSLNGFIFENIINHLKTKNLDLDILNLYDYADKIPFYFHDKEKLESNEFFQKNKNSILAADRILIVHPIYWYSTPGILKAWIDLITNYAYKYESGVYAKPLHKIKKAMLINTSKAPYLYRKFLTCNTATRQVRETLKFIGINDNIFYEIGSVYKLNDKKVNGHIKSIINKIDKFIK